MLAQNPELFLGEDLLAWLVLAFGGALVVGNVAALLRPPSHLRDSSGSDGGSGKRRAGDDDSGADRPPVARSAVMIIVGLLAAIWGLASLIGG